jgi:hypothetical protein
VDRVQTFVLHDDIAELLEGITKEYNYSPENIFVIGVQLFSYFLSMKNEGWDFGAHKMQEDGKTITLRNIVLPHEEKKGKSTFDIPGIDLAWSGPNSDDADPEDQEGYDEDDGDEPNWGLNLDWKPK